MNCQELEQYMGDAIDGVLPAQIRRSFEQHLELCSPCRTSYAFERLGKQVVRQKLQRVPTPVPVREEIVQLLRQRTERPKFPKVIERFFPLPALAGAAAIVATVLVLSRPQWLYHHTPPPDNIIAQSLRNFALVQSGQLKPEKISCTPEALSAYFEENGVSFIVSVMPVENCDWYGALLSEQQGKKFAHIVYKVGDHMMYMYQLPAAEIGKEGMPEVPAGIRESLATTGWWVAPDDQQQSVVLWTVNGTLCAAVSSMKRERLLAILTSP